MSKPSNPLPPGVKAVRCTVKGAADLIRQRKAFNANNTFYGYNLNQVPETAHVDAYVVFSWGKHWPLYIETPTVKRLNAGWPSASTARHRLRVREGLEWALTGVEESYTSTMKAVLNELRGTPRPEGFAPPAAAGQPESVEPLPAWMLSETPVPDDGWIEWGGGDCPVHPDTRVNVMLRCWDSQSRRERKLDASAGTASIYRWDHIGDIGDIVAYRVFRPESVPYESLATTPQPIGGAYRIR